MAEIISPDSIDLLGYMHKQLSGNMNEKNKKLKHLYLKNLFLTMYFNSAVDVIKQIRRRKVMQALFCIVLGLGAV